MSSFRRAPYYMAPVSVHRSRPCKLEFPCSLGDTVYELYGHDVIPMTVTGFLITQFDAYFLVEDNPQSLERRIAISNVYLSQEEAKKAAAERKR